MGRAGRGRIRENGPARSLSALPGGLIPDPAPLTPVGQPAPESGEEFTPNPAIFFLLNFDPPKDENAGAMLQRVWGRLSPGGTALMPLDTYPLREYYGWVQDRYGMSWQIVPVDTDDLMEPPEVFGRMLTMKKSTSPNCGATSQRWPGSRVSPAIRLSQP